MKTPPGPHAMTAQAGAVAAWRELFTQADIDAAVKAGDRIEFTAFKSDSLDLPDSDQDGSEGWIRAGCPTIFHITEGRLRASTTPAAVPVEALEGLVAKWLAYARVPGHSSELRCTQNGARLCADELTQLIKERSNG